MFSHSQVKPAHVSIFDQSSQILLNMLDTMSLFLRFHLVPQIGLKIVQQPLHHHLSKSQYACTP